MSIFETVRPMILDLFSAYDGGPNGSYGIQLNTNTTGDAGLSVEMKTYYSDYLIDLAEAELIFDRYGQKHPIPRNGGKTIEFRQYNQLPELLTPLTEGVTPDGQSLSVTNKTATVAQYGGYVTLSDMLLLTAIDNNLLQATKIIASQAGRTSDGITRDVVNAGTNVRYAGGVSSRSALQYGVSTKDLLTVRDVKLAVRDLEAQNAPKINGSYIGIIHPHVAFDLMNDSEWKAPHQYVDTANIYDNEIGSIAGVRFIENTRSKVWGAEDLASDSRTLAVNGAVSASTSITFDGGTVAAGALVGRKIRIGTTITRVTANTTSTITTEDNVTAADNAVIYPGEGGVDGAPVYATMIIGDDAYGVTEPNGGGLQHIVKQLGSAGSADPLNQRSTVGFKLAKVAEILVDQYMVRIESVATP